MSTALVVKGGSSVPVQAVGSREAWRGLMGDLTREALIRKILGLEKKVNHRLEAMAPAVLKATLNTCLCCLGQVTPAPADASYLEQFCERAELARCRATKMFRLSPHCTPTSHPWTAFFGSFLTEEPGGPGRSQNPPLSLRAFLTQR